MLRIGRPGVGAIAQTVTAGMESTAANEPQQPGSGIAHPAFTAPERAGFADFRRCAEPNDDATKAAGRINKANANKVSRRAVAGPYGLAPGSFTAS